jgi:hypothetical protein
VWGYSVQFQLALLDDTLVQEEEGVASVLLKRVTARQYLHCLKNTLSSTLVPNSQLAHRSLMSPSRFLFLFIFAPCLCFSQTSSPHPYLAVGPRHGASSARTLSSPVSLRQKIAQARTSRGPRIPASFPGEMLNGNAGITNTLAKISIAGSPQTSFVTTQDTGYLPVATVTGDFNGDGKMDWAAAMAGDSTIWIYLGNGDGTWKMPEILALRGSRPIGLAAADLRHTGRKDLIVAETNSNTVGVLLSNGDGTFQTETEFPLPTYPESIITGDFNGDGNIDVVVGNNPNGNIGPVTFLAGDGTGKLGTPIHGQTGDGAGAVSLAAADFNGDGKLDLMVSGDPNGSDYVGAEVALGNGDGTFRAGQLLQEDGSGLGGVTAVTAAPVADIDHDGCIDAVTVDVDGLGKFYKGNCDGTFQTPFSWFSLGDSVVSASLVDINGDGNLDVVGGGSQQFSPSADGANAGNLITISLGDGKGGFSTDATVYRAGTDLYALAATDLHGSGKLDLIAPSLYASVITVLTNDGQGHFQAPSGSSLGYYGGGPLNASISVPAVLDLNGDGLPDLAILRGPDYGGDPSTLFVLPQQPNGTFRAPISSEFIPDTYDPNVPAVFAFGNFRGRGAQDVIALSFTETASSFYFAPNDGKGNFGAGTMIDSPAANGQVAVGDFNGDGKLDFVAAGGSSSGDSLTIFLGNGDGTFTQQSTHSLPNSTGGTADGAFVGDFNRDGHLDVLVHYFVVGEPGALYEAFGDGKGGFTSSTEIATLAPHIFVADLNHDGCPDIVAGDSATSRPGFAVYLCQADGSFKGPQVYTPFLNVPAFRPFGSWIAQNPSQPFTGDSDNAPLVADVDGDGIPDVELLEQEEGDGPAAIFYATGNGDGTFTQHLLRIPTFAPVAPEFLGDIQGKGISGSLQLDTLTSALNAAVGVSNHANFSIEFRALPVSGNEGHLRLLVDAPASTSESFNLSSSNAQAQVPSQVTVPKGSTYVDIDFPLAGSFDYTHAFLITATQGTENHQALGYAVNHGLAAIAITPAFLDFGNVDLGVQSAAQQVTITNFGSAGLTDLNPYTQFDVISNNCGATLAAGASCNVQIAVTPNSQNTELGPRVTGKFVVSSAQGTSSIPLWAYGVKIQTTLSLSPSTLSFAASPGKTASPQSVTITNTGNQPLTFTEITPPSNPFQQTANTCTEPIEPQATCQLAYTFAAPETPLTSPETAVLNIYGDFTGSPTITLNATPAASGQIQVSPSSLNFGTAVNTTSSNQTVTVTNTGGVPLYISSIQQSHGVSQTSNCTTQALSPNQTCAIVSGVSSSTTGTFSGSLTVANSSANNPSLTIPVSASFAPLSLQLATGSSANLTLTAGQTAHETVVVYDGATTTVNLTCSSQVLTCTMSPSSITAPANGSNVVVSIQASGSSASLTTRQSSRLWFALLFPFVSLLCFRQRRYRYYVSFIVIVLCGFAFSACGTHGSSSGQTGSGGSSNTYTVNLTATDGTSSVTQAFTITAP